MKYTITNNKMVPDFITGPPLKKYKCDTKNNKFNGSQSKIKTMIITVRHGYAIIVIMNDMCDICW